jgi:hypothetical protein
MVIYDLCSTTNAIQAGWLKPSQQESSGPGATPTFQVSDSEVTAEASKKSFEGNLTASGDVKNKVKAALSASGQVLTDIKLTVNNPKIHHVSLAEADAIENWLETDPTCKAKIAQMKKDGKKLNQTVDVFVADVVYQLT